MEGHTVPGIGSEEGNGVHVVALHCQTQRKALVKADVKLQKTLIDKSGLDWGRTARREDVSKRGTVRVV